VIPYDQVLEGLKQFCSEHKLGTVYPGLELSKEFKTDVEIAINRGTEFFVDPMPPIDFVSVKTVNEPAGEEPQDESEKKSHYYTLFWYVSPHEQNIEKLEQRLRFYQCHLSRVVPIKAIKMILVICKDTSLDLPLVDNMVKTNGFGLLKFEDLEKKPVILDEPLSFREHMEEVIRNPLETDDMVPLSEEVKKEAKNVGLYLDRFVRETIDALAGQSPRRIGKRYIDRRILDLAFQIDNVCYADTLKDLVTNHLQEKTDDFEFVNKAFSVLWEKNFPEIEYTDFLKKAEIPLYNIFAGKKHPYRDHYLHQFQVFMLGSAIIDKLMSSKHKDVVKPQFIDKQWLVTSSFHDVAYPLQLYDSWAKDFFKESLGIQDLGVSDIKSYFVEKSLLSSVGFIIDEFCKRHFKERLSGNWLNEEKNLLLFFYDRITKHKHHSTLGSIFLLKQAQEKSPENLETIFVPSALAIALHHYDEVFKNVYEANNELDKAWENLPDNRKIKTIDFVIDPLTFILMYCDCAQDWGRPKANQKPRVEGIEGQNFVLDNCCVSDDQCSIRLVSPGLESIDEDFIRMETEIRNLKKMLRTPKNFDFRITLVDRSGDRSECRFKCTP
jgi:hypothetical protein